MAQEEYYIALDQGTTSSRAVLYSSSGAELRICSKPLKVEFPQRGWVEQDPIDIWTSQLAVLKEVAADIPPEAIRSIGISNQRETTLVWDRESGEVLAPAIVWQCRRSSEICERLRSEGLEKKVLERTGLVIDSYFSATKIMWLLENVSGLKEKAKNGRAVFGTVDSWLLYKLTSDKEKGVFLTEPSNACRTMLYSHDGKGWDPELLAVAGIGEDNLAEIRSSDALFGSTSVLGRPVAIHGMLGDQQSSLLGHGCVEKDAMKCTFGTGAFLLLNTGQERKSSKSGMLASVGWSLGGADESQSSTTYVEEGSVFVAGAIVEWLRDNMGFISSSSESEAVAASVKDSGGVLVVPAFVGLGSPYWDENARGAVFGITRGTTSAHIVRASLEGVAHQIADLVEAPEFSSASVLRVDGGMSRNSLFNQILADITARTIEVPGTIELTALGAARIAAIGTESPSDLASFCDGFRPTEGSGPQRISPTFSQNQHQEARNAWKEAIQRVRT